MSGGFVKLYGTILTSSVWVESHETFRVWMAMLVLADRKGYVAGTPPGIASIARVTLDQCEASLNILLSPDKHSRTKALEGRRILPAEGGWTVVNHDKYREMRSESQIATAERVKKYRAENVGRMFVYYVRDGAQIKVGVSNNPGARLNELRTARPNARLIAIENGDRALERRRHQEFGRTDFRNNRRGAEWFDSTPLIEQFLVTLSNAGNSTDNDVTHQSSDGRVQRTKKDTATTARTAPPSWLSHVCDVYERHYGAGSFPHGKAGKILKPLHEAGFSGEEIASRLDRYANALDDIKYLSLAKFRESFAGFAENAKTPKDTKGQTAGQRQFNKLVERA
jgi:hypothetical protein